MFDSVFSMVHTIAQHFRVEAVAVFAVCLFIILFVGLMGVRIGLNNKFHDDDELQPPPNKKYAWADGV